MCNYAHVPLSGLPPHPVPLFISHALMGLHPPSTVFPQSSLGSSTSSLGSSASSLGSSTSSLFLPIEPSSHYWPDCLTSLSLRTNRHSTVPCVNMCPSIPSTLLGLLHPSRWEWQAVPKYQYLTTNQHSVISRRAKTTHEKLFFKWSFGLFYHIGLYICYSVSKKCAASIFRLIVFGSSGNWIKWEEEMSQSYREVTRIVADLSYTKGRGERSSTMPAQ